MEELCLKWSLSKETKVKAVVAFFRMTLLYLTVYAALLLAVYFIGSSLKPSLSLEKGLIAFFIYGGVLILITALRCTLTVLFSKSSYQITKSEIQQIGGWSFAWDQIKGYSLLSETLEIKPAVLILHTDEHQVSLALPEDFKLNSVLSILADKLVIIEELAPKHLPKRLKKGMIINKRQLSDFCQ